jgi:folate-binding protein YgfZ
MTRPARLNRSLIAVTGPETHGFLQNLLTQDLDKLSVTGVVYAALLSPQGKVIADMFVWAKGDGLLLDVDHTRAGDLLRKLSMYKLRANVAIEDITGRFHVLAAPDPFRGSAPDPRFPGGELGWRDVSPLPTEQVEFADGAEAFEARRIALGVPDFVRDAHPEEVFAGEALLEELNGVAFDKGCFVGQENVSRMKRRATTRKKFCPIVFEAEIITPGTPIVAGAAELGSVRSGVAGRAIALLRLDRALEATKAGTALSAGGQNVRLDPPPWLILPEREGAAS